MALANLHRAFILLMAPCVATCYLLVAVCRLARAHFRLKIEASARSHDEDGDIAVKAFGLSQSLMDNWVTADFAAKRRILEII